jgi:outer membrane autotransporter protein
MIADLFLITSTANYNIALNQLSGSVYANYLQSFPGLGVHYNDLIDHATNCEVPALAGSALGCRNDAPVHVWGQADYQWRKADSDIEAGEAKAKRFTGLIGVDARVADSTVVGISGGYVTNNVRDHQFGDNAKATGGQVGLYAAYDPGAFYLKGVGTYSFYNGDSSRNIDFTGLGSGLTFAGRTNGSPDVNMWTLGVRGGYRVPLSDTSALTPYLDYDYVNAKLKGFTEDGLEGADLTVESSSSKHSFLTGGLKWATAMGGVVPEVNLGYRYRFGDKFATIHEAFIGDTDCDFDVISASQKKGTFLAGLSVGGKVGAADLRIGYEGEFNGDVTSHSGNFKVVIPLGGHAAPPPPPPPPVERGERG